MILPRDDELKFPHVFGVRASAGSGKTFLLSARFIQFILSPKIRANLSNTLAITFTNEATTQMKKRILNALKKIALSPNSPDVKPIMELITAEKHEISSMAREKVSDILEHYSEFQVRTIDSFINSIAKATAFELGIASEFEVESDRNSYYQLALDRLIEKVVSDTGIRKAFMEFLRSEIIKKGTWDINSELLNAVVQLLNKEAATGKTYDFLSPQAYEETVREAKSLVSLFLSRLSPYESDFKKNAIKGLRQFIEREIPHSSKFLLKNSVNELLKKGRDVPPELARLYDEITEKIEQSLFALAAKEFYYHKKFLELIREEVERLKLKNRVIFFDDINLSIKRLLQKMEIPEIFFKLGERIDHFLIDEFQDTNLLQWENLRLLIENALSEGGSLFIVGDRKQMIYRFRGSEPEIFERVISNNEFPSVPPENLRVFDTNYNWRSRKNIVEFNNKVFSPQNISRAIKDPNIDVEKIVKIYAESSQDVPPSVLANRAGGFVSIVPHEIEDGVPPGESVREQFMEIIKEVARRRPYSDIVVLVRKHQEGQRISSWLIDRGIPVISARSLDIRKDPIINNLIAFLKFLNMPIDNISFIATITGPAFLRASGLNGRAVLNWLQEIGENGSQSPYYRQFQAQFPTAWANFIEPFFRLVGFLPAYDLVREIILRWNLYENFKEHDASLTHLLEIIHSLEEKGQSDLSYLIELADSENIETFSLRFPQRFEGVRVMTMHAVKGLEFPVVIIPFIGLTAAGGKKEAPVIEYQDKSSLRLLKIKKDYIKGDSRVKEIYQKELTNRFIDELNLLYVACTRAIDELHIILNYRNKGESADRELVRLFVGDEIRAYSLGQPISSKITSYGPIEYLQSGFKHAGAWEGKLVRQKINLSDILHERGRAIKRGELVHGALARISWLPENQNEIQQIILKNLKIEVQKRGWLKFMDKLEDIAEQVTYALLDSRALRWFMPEGKNDIVFTEYEIVDRWGNTHRPDRIVLREKLVEIIEFKTGEKYADEHIRQVKTYAELVKSLYPDRPIRSFLFYIDESWVIPVDDLLF